jgi:hypothetical protein
MVPQRRALARLGGGLERTFTEAPDVRALTLHQGRLIAGGWFFGSGGSEPLQAQGLLTWDLTTETWNTLDGVAGSGAGQVHAIGSLGADVLVGGRFSAAGSSQQSADSRNVAFWRSMTNEWIAPEPGEGQPIDGPVYSLESMDGKLYAGGSFMRAGSLHVKALASWDGSMWDLVGTPQNEGGAEILALHRAHERFATDRSASPTRGLVFKQTIRCLGGRLIDCQLACLRVELTKPPCIILSVGRALNCI